MDERTWKIVVSLAYVAIQDEGYLQASRITNILCSESADGLPQKLLQKCLFDSLHTIFKQKEDILGVKKTGGKAVKLLNMAFA